MRRRPPASFPVKCQASPSLPTEQRPRRRALDPRPARSRRTRRRPPGSKRRRLPKLARGGGSPELAPGGGPPALSPSSTPPAAARLLHSTPPRIRLATPRRSGRSSPRARLAPPATLHRGSASPSRDGRALPRRLLRAHHYMFASSLFEDAELSSHSPSI